MIFGNDDILFSIKHKHIMSFKVRCTTDNIPDDVSEISIEFVDISELNIPDTITSVVLGSCNHALDKSSFPIFLKKLTIDCDYQHGFDSNSFPDGLESLVFKLACNCEITENVLPESLIELIFESSYVHRINKSILPANLKILYLPGNYNHLINPDSLPENLQELHMGEKYSHEIHRDIFPAYLKKLYLPNEYNQLLTADTIPEFLEILIIGVKYFHEFRSSIFPNSLIELTVSELFVYDNNIIPPNLERLIVRNELFVINNVTNIFPDTLKELYMGGGWEDGYANTSLPPNLEIFIVKLGDFGYDLGIPDVLPKSLRVLHVGHEYNRPIETEYLPDSLEYLALGHDFSSRIYTESIPSALKYIEIYDFDQTVIFNRIDEFLSISIVYDHNIYSEAKLEYPILHLASATRPETFEITGTEYINDKKYYRIINPATIRHVSRAKSAMNARDY